jgi:hypothetical protein
MSAIERFRPEFEAYIAEAEPPEITPPVAVDIRPSSRGEVAASA